MTPNDPLTTLLLRLQDGDRSAFDPAYESVAPRVDALCARLLGPGPDAEDAAQQALMRLFERVSAFDPERGPALPWVLGIAAWEARTVRRRRERRREEPWADRSEAAPPTDERWDELERVLATLGPADREVVSATLGRAEPPDLAPATARKRLQRALDRIRSALGRTT